MVLIHESCYSFAGISEDQEAPGGAVQNSGVKITEIKETSDMSTQSEKPQEGGSAAVNGESSGAHSDYSETNNASLDAPSDTNTEASPSDGDEETPSNGSDKSESGVEHVESSDVQPEGSDNNHSSDVNPEVVDFVNDVVSEVASQVEEKHGDATVHDATAQATDSHGSAENGEYIGLL